MTAEPAQPDRPWWDRWPWALALLPLIYAGLRVLIVAQGDTEIMRTLVQNIDVTGLLLATFLPVGSTIALWTFIGVLARRANEDRKAGRSNQTFGWSLLPGVAVIAMTVAAMPTYLVVVNGIVIGLIIVLILFALLPGTSDRRKLVVLVLIGFVGVCALVLFSVMLVLGFGQSTWLPRERVEVLGQKPTYGYVVSADPRWTKLLSDDRRIEVVPSPYVLARHAIQSTPSDWYRPLVNASSDPISVGVVVTAVLSVLAVLGLMIQAAVATVAESRKQPNGLGTESAVLVTEQPK